MSDFGALSENLLNDDDFLAMDDATARIWLLLQVPHVLPGKCGIFKGGISALAGKLHRPVEVIESAMQEFERLGWVIRDGDWRWVKNRIKHNGHNKAWRLGAINEVRELAKSITLARQCLDYYGEPLAPEAPKDDRGVPAGYPPPNRGVPAGYPPPNRGVPAAQPAVLSKAKQSKAKQISSNATTLAELEARLHQDCREQWESWKRMAQRRNGGNMPAEGWFVTRLMDIISLTEGMDPAAINHGFCRAMAANNGQGSDSPKYIANAAQDRGASSVQQQDDFNPDTLLEVVS